jgi:hypothetical protein
VGNHRRTTRFGFQEFTRDTDLIEEFGYAFGGNALTRTRIRTEVGGVDPDQLSAQLDNLSLRPVVRAHRFIFAYAAGAYSAR